jgi:hypothetical protein
MRADEDTSRGERPAVTEKERDEVLGLSNDPVLRRAWLLYLAQKHLPLEQAIDWARRAEQFIAGSHSDAHPASSRALLHSGVGSSRRHGAGIRDQSRQGIRHRSLASFIAFEIEALKYLTPAQTEGDYPSRT